MIETALALAAIYLFIFVMNLMPALMPATWMVLAFFHIRFELPLLPLTVGGAIASGFGRLLLAKGSGLARRRFMKRHHADLAELGSILERRRGSVGVFVFLYALLLPLPNSHLFIAGGLLQLSILRMLIGFWAGRIIADTFWVWTADRAFASLDDLFGNAFGSAWGVALQVLALASLLSLLIVPWARWSMALVRRWASRSPGGRGE